MQWEIPVPLLDQTRYPLVLGTLTCNPRGNVGYGLNTRVHITIPGPRPTVAVVAQAATVVAPTLLLRGRESIRTWRSW